MHKHVEKNKQKFQKNTKWYEPFWDMKISEEPNYQSREIK